MVGIEQPEEREERVNLLGEADLPQRPGYESNVIRMAHRETVDAHVAAAFARMSVEEATAKLRESGTAYGLVNDLPGFARHPALRRVSLETEAGPASIVAPAVIRDGASPHLGPVPSIGEHTAAIRAEFG